MFIHPNDRISALSPYELIDELKSWKRDDMLAWLCWSNHNGSCSNGLLLKFLIQKMPREEMIETMLIEVEKIKGLIKK
jgi:hypothetical protein